ncbi:MAG: hypothetical protein Q7S61_06080 [bacterium]|nr:hypothetical protein [bacterium]
MKKLLFIFIVSFILLFPYTVSAQANCGNALSDTPEGRKCCCADIENPTVDDQLARPVCIKNVLIDFCPDVLGWMRTWTTKVSSIFYKDEETILQYKYLRACSNGQPSTLEFKDLGPIPGGDIYHRNDVCNASCGCKVVTTSGSVEFCDRYLLLSKDYTQCRTCFLAPSNGFWTGIGCVYVGDYKNFIEKNIFGLVVSIAGLISFLCIVYSAISIQMSQGAPEKLKNAQQTLTSCIMGLLLILFSVFILRLIGVTILSLPSLGG